MTFRLDAYEEPPKRQVVWDELKRGPLDVQWIGNDLEWHHGRTVEVRLVFDGAVVTVDKNGSFYNVPLDGLCHA